MTYEEIDCDLGNIANLCKTIFNQNVEIHIIPHLNLVVRLTNEYITERNVLVHILECLYEKHDIKMHNIGKYIEENIETNSNECFLDTYMEDSIHYSQHYEKIKGFLIGI